MEKPEDCAVEEMGTATSEICDIIGDNIRALVGLWRDLGIDGEAMRSHVERTKRHLVSMFTAMRDDLEEMKKRILLHISSYTSEVERLASELAVPVTLPEGRTVVQQEEEMRVLVQRLQEIRSSRRRELHRLRSEEADLCHRLEEPAFAFGNGGSLPSQEELHELQEHLHALKQKKAMRTCEFRALQRDIVAQLRLVGAVPHMQLEKEIVDHPENFILSLQNLEKAATYLQKLKDLAHARREEIVTLMEQLNCYYDRLDVPEEEQLRCAAGLTAEVINTMKEELARLKDLKKQRLWDFVERTQDELFVWRQKCCVPQMLEEQDDEAVFPDVSENLLENMEQEILGYKELYEENGAMFLKVERREALWSRFLELEKNSNDPSCFNRNAAKEHSRLQAELPRLEQEIRSYIKNYSGSKQEVFSRWGEKFLSHIAAQNQAYHLQKEQQWLERVRGPRYLSINGDGQQAHTDESI